MLYHVNGFSMLIESVKSQASKYYYGFFKRRLIPLQVPSFIAVTIGIRGVYPYLAQRAAESCVWSTSLPTFIVARYALERFPSCVKGNRLKFHLFDLFPEATTILYFDADTLFLKQWDVSSYAATESFICVRDQENKWSSADSEATGVPLSSYFNSGFFIASRKTHQPMFELANRLYQNNFPTTLIDQGYLNRARYDLAIPIELLPQQYNSVAYEWREGEILPTIAHFNGSGSLPRSTLESRYKSLSPAYLRARTSWIDWKHCAYRVRLQSH